MMKKNILIALVILLITSFAFASCGRGSYTKQCMCPVRKAT